MSRYIIFFMHVMRMIALIVLGGTCFYTFDTRGQGTGVLLQHLMVVASVCFMIFLVNAFLESYYREKLYVYGKVIQKLLLGDKKLSEKERAELLEELCKVDPHNFRS